MPVLNHPDGSPISEANPLPVSGSFSIASEIEIKNDAGSPVPVAGTVALDSASLAALENTSVTGSVSITNLPTTQAVSGTVELGSTSLAALENTTVIVSNLPSTQVVSGTVELGTATLNALETITVSVSNLPATQAVSGTVELGATSLAALENTTVTVGNFPTSQTISNFPATQAVSGSVGINNFPVTQPVNGTVSIGNTPSVSVSNFPATQAVTVGNFPATQPVSGSVSISNSPAVTVSNFPTTQPVSGSVSITGNVNTVQSGVGTAAGTPFYEAQVVGGVVVGYTNPLPCIVIPTTLIVANVTAAAAGATITLPAGGVNTFHYIDAIELTLYTSTARTGAATAVTVTSTNLGGYGLTFASAAAIGTTDRYSLTTDRPLRSTASNTATTIVLPVVTGAFWRYNVMYSLGQ
jgi:hypothetical protein